MVADSPSDHHVFVSAFTGERELLATSNGISVRMPRGTIDVMTPAAYAQHFGIAPPDRSRGARIAALILAARDMPGVSAMLARASVPAIMRTDRLVVGPRDAMGAAIVFAEPCLPRSARCTSLLGAVRAQEPGSGGHLARTQWRRSPMPC